MRAFSPTAEQWDRFVLAQPEPHVLQLSTWGRLKGAYGWGVERVALGDPDGDLHAGAQLLFRRLPLRAGAMAYLAMGPYPPAAPDALWQAIHQRARARRAAFLKWEPGLFAGAAPDPSALGFRPSPQTVQPPRTIVLDLRGDDDALLARMNQGTRRKIRQSLKNGVTYREASRADLERFTRLMTRTGERNDFGVHAPDYYALAYDLFVPGQAALILAEHEGDALAGVMVFACGPNAWYLYGASADLKRSLMASYGAQWTAIQWARARGCTTYDLWGIPDEEEAALEAGFESRSDGLWGVYGFKRGWGGQVVRSLGAWDYPYQPLLYRGYQWAARVRG